MESKEFKTFWEGQKSPVHAHSNDYWFDRYAEEILFFLRGRKVIVDAGCGSGEILERIAPHFEKITAIDYSSSMLALAQEKMKNRNPQLVSFACDSITNIKEHCQAPVDGIFSNGVIQYLSNAELIKFIESSSDLLRTDGMLLLFNVPNRNSRLLFMLGFYKHEKYVSFFKVLKGLFGLGFKILADKVRNGFRSYPDGIGNWYTMDQLKKLGAEKGFTVEIYGSTIVNYYYRFHAILRKNG